MKKIFVLLGLIMILSVSAVSQAGAKRPALPGNLARYINAYPVTLMKLKSVRTRLKTLLGRRYPDFVLSIQVQSQMTKVGDFLFARGCMPHLCTINEAAFAIDLKNKRIHAVVYEEDAPTKFFNEDKARTPQVPLDWVEAKERM